MSSGAAFEQLWKHAEPWGSPRTAPSACPPTTSPARVPEIELPQTFSAADMLHGPAPVEPDLLVDPVIRAGQLTVVGAPRKIGKSWLAANLGWLVGSGRGYLLDTFPVRAQVPTLLLSGESSPWASRTRWQLLATTAEDTESLPNFTECHEPLRVRVRQVTEDRLLRTGTRSRSTQLAADLDVRLEPLVQRHTAGLLIVDPWARFYDGDENSNDQTEAAVAALLGLAQRTGIAIVVFHHLGKASEGRDPEDLWRGASRLPDAADTLVTMLPHYTQRQARELGLSRSEARRYVDVHMLCRHADVEAFSVRRTPSGWWTAWEPDADTSPRPTERLAPTDVAAALRTSGGAWGSAKEARVALGCSESRARAALNAATAAGAVVLSRGPQGSQVYRVPGTKRLDEPDDDDLALPLTIGYTADPDEDCAEE